MWREEYMLALNQIVELIYQRIKLGIVDTTFLGTLHMDADKNNGSAMLT